MPLDRNLLGAPYYPGPPDDSVVGAAAAASDLTRCHGVDLDNHVALVLASCRAQTTLRFSSDGNRPDANDPGIFVAAGGNVRIVVPRGQSLWYATAGNSNGGGFASYRVTGFGWRRNLAPAFADDTTEIALAANAASDADLANPTASDADGDEIYWSEVGDWDSHFSLDELDPATNLERNISYTRAVDENSDPVNIPAGTYQLTVGITDRQPDHELVTRTYVVTVT